MSHQVDKNINQLFIDKFSDFENQLNGQKALPIHDLRKKALIKFKELGIPNTHEEYKYTNFKKALSKNFTFNQLFKNNDDASISQSDYLINELEGNVLVFINGQFSEDASHFNNNEIDIKPLTKAYSENPNAITKHFGNLYKDNEDSYALLNSTFCNNGVFAQIGKNKIVNTPIIIYNISDASKDEAISFPRNLIIAESGSQSSVIEVFSTIGEKNSFSNAVNEITIDENAILNYYKILDETEHVYHIGLTQASQKKNSTINAHSYTFGGGIIRNNLHIEQEGENCTTNMFGLYLLNGNSHVDNHTEVDHKKPNSYSNELYKGILDEKSTGVFNGKIFVRKEAQKTNAFQSNKNILLTDEATVNSKPQLEIWADDVKCSHGCTTGQMDEEALFYLRSRGIDKDKARAMLLYAFSIDVLKNVTIEPLKKYLDHIIALRFNQNEL
ncbi:MAG: Fe-S cluster assembly protein SufD [Cyclobacteriaceae bacterium]|nr:Fe-S cluster assembly protein SufD [Cyclobacteriaceae bacterium]